MKYHLSVYRTDGEPVWTAPYKTMEEMVEDAMRYCQRGFLVHMSS